MRETNYVFYHRAEEKIREPGPLTHNPGTHHVNNILLGRRGI